MRRDRIRFAAHCGFRRRSERRLAHRHYDHALHIAHTTIRGFNQGVQVSGAPYASVSISHSELTNNVVAAHADNGGLLAMEGNRLVHNGTALSLARTGVAFSAGENCFAFHASDGSPFTATAGLK